MKVLIVSDTHGHDENLERAVMTGITRVSKESV